MATSPPANLLWIWVTLLPARERNCASSQATTPPPRTIVASGNVSKSRTYG